MREGGDADGDYLARGNSKDKNKEGALVKHEKIQKEDLGDETVKYFSSGLTKDSG